VAKWPDKQKKTRGTGCQTERETGANHPMKRKQAAPRHDLAEAREVQDKQNANHKGSIVSGGVLRKREGKPMTSPGKDIKVSSRTNTRLVG